MSAQDKDAVLRQFGRKRNHVETDRVLEHPDGTVYHSRCLETHLQEEFKAGVLKLERMQTTISAFYVPFPWGKNIPRCPKIMGVAE